MGTEHRGFCCEANKHASYVGGEQPWEPGTECTQSFHLLIAFALETWLWSHQGMGEYFVMDKRAHFKKGNKCFCGLRGSATGVCTKEQARVRFRNNLEEPSTL